MANQHDVCLACTEALPHDGAMMICLDCNYGYHLGSCSGVTENAYRKKGASTKKTWICPTCKISKERGGQASQQKPGEPDIRTALSEITKKLTELACIKEKVETLLSMKSTVDNIESSVKLMSAKYDDVLDKMKEQDKEILTLKKKVEQVERRTNDGEVKALRKQVNELEQYGRRQNMEIRGLQQTDNENLLSELNTLAHELQLTELSQADLDGLHRLPKKPGKPAPVLIRFTSRATRDKWFEKRRELQRVKPDIIFLDNLTAQNKRLLWMAKTKAREEGFQFAWQKNGKILVRRGPGEPAIRIESEDDLEKVK